MMDDKLIAELRAQIKNRMPYTRLGPLVFTSEINEAINAGIDAALAAIYEQGYAVVPVVPTDAQIKAGAACYDATWGYNADSGVDSDWAEESYKAMLKAAQEE